MAANSEHLVAHVYPTESAFEVECSIISISKDSIRFRHKKPRSKTMVTRVIPMTDVIFLEGKPGKEGRIKFSTKDNKLVRAQQFDDVNVDSYNGEHVTFTGKNRRGEVTTVTALRSQVSFEQEETPASSGAAPAKKKKKKA